MQKNYINSQEPLNQLLSDIQAHKLIAIDTEFTRQKTYYPILSLIQIAVKDQTYAIDCQAKIDLQPLYNIIKDEKIKKIFHSCLQDLQIFQQKSNKIAKNIDDVQMMANFCGIGYNIGYSGLVEELTGVKLDKKMQRSDWQKRPLSNKQVEYALLDVFYLEDLHQKLSKDLEKRGRYQWFMQDMQEMTHGIFHGSATDNLFKNYIKNRKSYRKNPEKLSKLKELIIWREEMAQKHDVPRQHFLSDVKLDKIVLENDLSLKMAKKYIKQIEKILQAKDKFKLDFELKSAIMNEEQKEKFQKARQLVEKTAAQNDLRAQFLLTSQNIKDIILGKTELEKAVTGWRHQLLGQKLEKII